jgi:hypothetical protein
MNETAGCPLLTQSAHHKQSKVMIAGLREGQNPRAPALKQETEEDWER